VNNVGTQLRLPKEDIEGLKLCATGGRRCRLAHWALYHPGRPSKRDYLAFDCAMREEGQVRLHTGGYSVSRCSAALILPAQRRL
jgi:hypothetical protein